MLGTIVLMAMHEASKGKIMILHPLSFISNWDYIEYIYKYEHQFKGKFHMYVINDNLYIRMMEVK